MPLSLINFLGQLFPAIFDIIWQFIQGLGGHHVLHVM